MKLVFLGGNYSSDCHPVGTGTLCSCSLTMAPNGCFLSALGALVYYGLHHGISCVKAGN